MSVINVQIIDLHVKVSILVVGKVDCNWIAKDFVDFFERKSFRLQNKSESLLGPWG